MVGNPCKQKHLDCLVKSFNIWLIVATWVVTWMEKKIKKIGTVKEVEAEKEPGMHGIADAKGLYLKISENVSLEFLFSAQ